MSKTESVKGEAVEALVEVEAVLEVLAVAVGTGTMQPDDAAAVAALARRKLETARVELMRQALAGA